MNIIEERLNKMLDFYDRHTEGAMQISDAGDDIRAIVAGFRQCMEQRDAYVRMYNMDVWGGRDHVCLEDDNDALLSAMNEGK